MDAGARDSLADVISKSLVKLATQPEGKVIIVVEKICLDFWVNSVACFDLIDIPGENYRRMWLLCPVFP